MENIARGINPKKGKGIEKHVGSAPIDTTLREGAQPRAAAATYVAQRVTSNVLPSAKENNNVLRLLGEYKTMIFHHTVMTVRTNTAALINANLSPESKQ